MTEVFVPKGTMLLVDVAAVNTATSVWGKDAGEWKPERWLSEMPQADARIPGVYGNMLTFAGGARSCMYATGLFAIVQVH